MSKAVQIDVVRSLMPSGETNTVIFHLLDDGRVFANYGSPEDLHIRRWDEVTKDAPWLTASASPTEPAEGTEQR